MAETIHLEECLMEALFAGVFYDGVFAVFFLGGVVVAVVMTQLLDESAFAVNHVVVVVNGKLLLAKVHMVLLYDIVADQTAFVVLFPIGCVGRPFMRLIDDLLAIRALLIVIILYQCVFLGTGLLHDHPRVGTFVIKLGEFVRLFHLYPALVGVTITDVFLNVAVRILVVDDRSELRLVGMPAEDEIALAAAMTTAPGLVFFQVLRLGGGDVHLAQHLLVEIQVAGTADIDMGLFCVCPAIAPIVATVKTAFIILFIVFFRLLIEDGWRVFLATFLERLAIPCSPVRSYFDIGNVFRRVGGVLRKGKHIAASSALTEVQIGIVSTVIAISLVGNFFLIIKGNDFYLRHHALCSCRANEKRELRNEKCC